MRHAEVLAYADVVGNVIPFVQAERTLYVRRDVLNADEIIAWAKSEGFTTTLAPDDMHVTQAYSRAEVKWGDMGDSFDRLRATGGKRSVSFLGDKGGIVLKFQLGELSRRWQELVDRGCSWDYESYQPHVTLTYSNPDNIDPDTIAPYDGPIELGPEKFEALDLDWSDKVKALSEQRFSEIADRLDALEARLRKDAKEVFTEWRDKLAGKITRAYPDLRGLAKDLRIPRRGDLTAVLTEALRRTWERGALDARREVREGRRAVRSLAGWDESKHPRVPKGSGDDSGEWASGSLLDGVFYHAATKGEFGDPSVEIGNDFDIWGKGFYFGGKDYVERNYGKPEPFHLKGRFAPEKLWVAALVKVQKLPFDKGRQSAREELRAAGFSGIWNGKQGVVWDQTAVRRLAFNSDVLTFAGTDSTFTPRSALRWLGDKAFWITGVVGDRLLNDAKGVILQGMAKGKPLGEIILDLVEVFAPYIGDEVDEKQASPHRLETIIRTNTTDAYNHGRLTQFVNKEMLPFLNGVRYSAVLDERTTEICRFLDNKVFKPGSPDLEALIPPNHFNCRSIIVPIVVGESIPPEDFITPAEVGQARGLADAKFLTTAGAWKAYSEREDD